MKITFFSLQILLLTFILLQISSQQNNFLKRNLQGKIPRPTPTLPGTGDTSGGSTSEEGSGSGSEENPKLPPTDTGSEGTTGGETSGETGNQEGGGENVDSPQIPPRGDSVIGGGEGEGGSTDGGSSEGGETGEQGTGGTIGEVGGKIPGGGITGGSGGQYQNITCSDDSVMVFPKALIFTDAYACISCSQNNICDICAQAYYPNPDFGVDGTENKEKPCIVCRQTDNDNKHDLGQIPKLRKEYQERCSRCNPDQCLECGYSLQDGDNPQGFTFQPEGHTCKRVVENCEIAEEEFGDCIQCKNGYMKALQYDSNGQPIMHSNQLAKQCVKIENKKIGGVDSNGKLIVTDLINLNGGSGYLQPILLEFITLIILGIVLL